MNNVTVMQGKLLKNEYNKNQYKMNGDRVGCLMKKQDQQALLKSLIPMVGIQVLQLEHQNQ